MLVEPGEELAPTRSSAALETLVLKTNKHLKAIAALEQQAKAEKGEHQCYCCRLKRERRVSVEINYTWVIHSTSIATFKDHVKVIRTTLLAGIVYACSVSI